MQRAVSVEREMAPASGKDLPSPQSTGQFVINLCASTTPMALGQNNHPALKRYKFFVSRRREDGRERFRMHLGFFQTQEEAEGLLEVVREFYPAAWAGVAPGQKLRNEAAAAAAAAAGLAQPSINSIAIVAVSEPAAAEPEVAAEPVAARPATAQPAAARPVTTPPVAATPAPVAEPVRPAASVVAPPPAAAVPAAIDYVPEAPSAPMELSLVEQPPRPSPTSRALEAVRAAISSLDDSGTRGVPTLGAPTVRPIPELRASSNSGSFPSLDDSQVLRVLEAPVRAPASQSTTQPSAVQPAAAQVAPQPAPMPAPVAATATAAAPAKPVKPAKPVAPSAPSLDSSDERTMIAPAYVLPKPAPMPAPAASATSPPAPQGQAQAAAYAVQLVWSVQPIDVSTVPQLAIFAAYTLYAAEGNRDGRRWYGLRLGFFTDPVSARQVAQYVRSEFNSVSVVPVTAREAERAVNAPPRPSTPAAAPAAAATAKSAEDGAPVLTTKSDEEFKLLDSRPRPRPAVPAPTVQPKPSAAGKAAPGKRAKLRPAAGAPPEPQAKAAKTRRAPLTLEETLEILGAGELQMAENRVELLSDSGVRHLSQQAMKPARSRGSRFSRLMDRLSERKSS